jgi:putative oxidoreductase
MSDQAYHEELPAALPAALARAVPGPGRRVVDRMLGAARRGRGMAFAWLIRYSLLALRVSLGAVFLGFGVLKYFPGVSPAQSLVLATLHLLSLRLVPSVIPGLAAMAFVATLESVIGLLLITGRRLRLAVVLLSIELAGILSPIVLLPRRMFAGPDHMPTLEGQYVLKDVILLAAGMVVAAVAGGASLVEAEPAPEDELPAGRSEIRRPEIRRPEIRRSEIRRSA